MKLQNLPLLSHEASKGDTREGSDRSHYHPIADEQNVNRMRFVLQQNLMQQLQTISKTGLLTKNKNESIDKKSLSNYNEEEDY